MENNNAEQSTQSLEQSVQAVETVPQLIAEPAENINNSRPEWLPEKFESPEALAKAYCEHEKIYSKAFSDRLDHYELEDDLKKQIKASENLKMFETVAKNNKLSNKFYNKILSDFVELEKQQVKEQESILEKEMKEIGSERINKVQNMINNLGIEEEQKQILKNTFGSNAQMFSVIENMLNNFNKEIEAFQPSTNISTVSNAKDQLENIYCNPDYARNPAKYFSEVKRLNEILAGM